MALFRLIPLICLMSCLGTPAQFVNAQGKYAPLSRSVQRPSAPGWRPAGRITPVSYQSYQSEQKPGMVRSMKPAKPSFLEYSWTTIEKPAEREYKVGDLVNVIVSEKSEVTINSRFNRQRTSSFAAELKEFVRITDGLTLENSASTSPGIDGSQQDRIQSTGQVTDREGITYRIAATIVDIRPNGNLILEARKKINTGDDHWEYRFHGEIRYEDILSNNTVLSENVANLDIEKIQGGRNHSSVKRRWGTKLYDMLWPF